MVLLVILDLLGKRFNFNCVHDFLFCIFIDLPLVLSLHVLDSFDYLLVQVALGIQQLQLPLICILDAIVLDPKELSGRPLILLADQIHWVLLFIPTSIRVESSFVQRGLENLTFWSLKG